MSGQFDKLEVYQLAVRYVGLTRALVIRLRREDPVLADQLHRAVISILLNIAEGAGEFSPRDKARFYRYALRSATESVGILDACREIRLSGEDEYTKCRDAGIRIVSMMTRLVGSVADRAAKDS
jgi:four helix bundle protein